MRLLDLFCGEGGAGVGYHRAGWDVTGVDTSAPRLARYPHPHVKADAIEYLLAHGHEYDAIHASPPCQGYLNLGAVNRSLGRDYAHSQMISLVRDALESIRKPYVIENVADARRYLRNPVRLCGTSFGLPLRRHRLFETTFALNGLECEHYRFTEPRYWTGWRPNGERRLSTVVQIYGNGGGRDKWPAALDVDWMSAKGMTEAVPPAYTEFIGAQLAEQIGRAAA